MWFKVLKLLVNSVVRAVRRFGPETDNTQGACPDLSAAPGGHTGVFRRAPRGCLCLAAAAALFVLLLCLSVPGPGSHSFLHAVRVGEASNPGPHGNSDTDSALASALLEVLKSWKDRVGREALLARLMLLMLPRTRRAKGKARLPRHRA